MESDSPLAISADSTTFSTDCLTARAGEKFKLSFENKEKVAHNFAILPKTGDGDPLFDTEIFPGPATRTVEGGPLEAGTYVFHCIVHPNMTGSFLVT